MFLSLQTQSTFKALYVNAEHKTYYSIQLPSIKYQRVEWLLNQRPLEAFQDHYWCSGLNQTVVRKRGQYASPFTNIWKRKHSILAPPLTTNPCSICTFQQTSKNTFLLKMVEYKQLNWLNCFLYCLISTETSMQIAGFLYQSPSPISNKTNWQHKMLNSTFIGWFVFGQTVYVCGLHKQSCRQLLAKRCGTLQ